MGVTLSGRGAAQQHDADLLISSLPVAHVHCVGAAAVAVEEALDGVYNAHDSAITPHPRKALTTFPCIPSTGTRMA